MAGKSKSKKSKTAKKPAARKKSAKKAAKPAKKAVKKSAKKAVKPVKKTAKPKPAKKAAAVKGKKQKTAKMLAKQKPALKAKPLPKPLAEAQASQFEKLHPDAGEETEKIQPDTDFKSDFYIDLRPRLIKLPDLKEKEKINVKYPLILPYAYAHVYWDSDANELVYDVEEPVLDDTEKELLKLVQLGLEEMINVSFVKTKNMRYIMQYLERNVQSIILELGAKISKKTYQKIMYYVYRNSIGLNEIEPLMNDYYIEDIECNGINVPLYIVHRKFENMRTNVLFKTGQDLVDFVEKLAQKSGRYVSYAKPLLDGTLPDGSRVNATYTQDVTTRGPTFTIRKFTREPWTPIHLMEFKTASAEVFAYLWMAVEHKFNVIAIGETGSGKTSFLNAIVNFIPPEARVGSIEDTRELNLAHENWLPAVTRSGFGIPNLVGSQYGEITLFDLLRETFRQNPDYVIVGEVRGEETFVLFQGMASGHPSFSTFHAGSVTSLMRRLSTPPINLSPSLIEGLNIVCVLTHIKTADKSIRRLKELEEIKRVERGDKADMNTYFKWDPRKDKINIGRDSVILKKISVKSGISLAKLKKEFARRVKILEAMKKKGIKDFNEFNKIINTYYKEPQQVLKRFKIK